MIPVPTGVRIWIATGHTDMRRGMRGLALQVQQGLGRDPFASSTTTQPSFLLYRAFVARGSFRWFPSGGDRLAGLGLDVMLDS